MYVQINFFSLYIFSLNGENVMEFCICLDKYKI